jgi:L-iditol 2-dehydrogenase
LKARQLVFSGRGEVSFQPFDIGPPADDQILVETLYTAISPGTERAFLLAEPNTITQKSGFPFTPGYSNVGRVLAAGSAVRTFKRGDLVATRLTHVSHFVLPETVGAQEPPEKYRGQFRSPIMPSEPAVGLHYIWPLSADLDEQTLKASAPFAIVGVGVTGARYARIDLGESVLVIGLGPVGLYAALSAKLAGGFPVLGLDLLASRRELAEDLGIDRVFATPADVDTPPAVVIEATGNAEAVNLAFRLCRRNGRVVLLGSTRGTTPQVDFYTDVHRKGLTVIGAHVLTRPVLDDSDGRWNAWDENALALRLIENGRLDSRPLIAHEFPIDRASDAYALIQAEPDTLGALLSWNP